MYILAGYDLPLAEQPSRMSRTPHFQILAPPTRKHYLISDQAARERR